MANLASKYRPKTFDDVVEQSLTVNLVRTMCESKTLENRCFLFIGSAGTGKTTLSKIIARELNEGKGQPIEVDAASHGSTEEMRQLMSQAAQFPIGMKYKVFIIDECHSISNTGWQVALLTLEQQPAKSVFIFCLDGDGIVPTAEGLKKLSDISVSDKVWDGDQYRNVLNVFDNGYKETLKLTLSNGNTLKCTPNHKIKVLDDDKLVWKRADELHVDDYILDYNNYISTCEAPISIEEAWFLGYLTGNGSYSSYSMDLYTPFKKWDKLKYYLDTLISQGIIKDYIQQSNEDAGKNHIYDTRIHFNSNKYNPAMSDWYSKVKLNPNYTRGSKSIPKIMYSASSEQIKAFIDGWYFADGDGTRASFFDLPYKKDTGKWISAPFIYCSNSDMVQDLQNLLKLIGWHSSVRRYSSEISDSDYEKNQFIRPGKYINYTVYLLRKCGFISDSRFRATLLHKYRNMPRGRYKLDLSNLNDPARNISPKMIDEAGYDYNKYGKFFKISSIESSGITHVYDIEIETSHQFIYNGVLVHNCTTNPEKIPATILSRVQTFKLSKISTKGIHNRLKYVIEQENKEGREITYTEEALDYIARLSNGGMRDSLTNLDRCLAYSKDVTMENVTKALDLPDYDTYFNLLNYLVKHDNVNITKIIDEVYNCGTNFVKWFEGFQAFLCNIIKYIYIKDIGATMIPSQYINKLSNYTENHAFICLKLSNLLMQLNRDLRTTQYQVETAMTYLCIPVSPKKEKSNE